MPTNFKPTYTINSATAKHLMRIEAVKEKVSLLPVNPTVLASLRETALDFAFALAAVGKAPGYQLKR